MALYNKMRPRNLGAVKGQGQIVEILKNNIASGNLPNAMLFIGTRGVGKTTVAKVVSRLINCEHPLDNGDCCDECPSCKAILSGTSLDVKELDAASNNGVDHIRDIIADVQYKAIGKYKVYIIDEVHMLSIGAFNALLKVMEEPPKNVLFILCTTELHKVPATIVSRCRKFQFESISAEVIVEKLKEINVLLGKEAEEEALFLVAKAAKGSMRDAESIYEAFLDTDGVITASHVREVLGFTAEESVFIVLDSIVKSQPVMATAVIEELSGKGGSLSFLLEECVRMLMDVISIKMSGDITDKGGNSAEYMEKISEYAFDFELPRLFEITDAFCKAYGNKQCNVLSFQAMLIELICTQSTVTDLLVRISALEKEVELLKTTGISYAASVPTETETMSMDMSDCQESFCDDYLQDDYMQTEEDANTSTVHNDIQNEDMIDSGSESSEQAPGQSDLSSAEEDELLRSLGFSVIDDNPFEEEELTDAMVEDDFANSSTENPKEQAESKKTEVSENADSSAEASFFDDFARLFGF